MKKRDQNKRAINPAGSDHDDRRTGTVVTGCTYSYLCTTRRSKSFNALHAIFHVTGQPAEPAAAVMLLDDRGGELDFFAPVSSVLHCCNHVDFVVCKSKLRSPPYPIQGGIL